MTGSARQRVAVVAALGASVPTLLLALGLFTRTVAFILAGDMAVPYFMAHAPRGFFPLLNGGELAIVYCFLFLYFWVAGGEWSFDRLRAPASASALTPSRA
jgi:putative oxidoreductase